MNLENKNTGLEDLEQAAAAWVFRREAGLTSEEELAFARWQDADPRHVAALTRHGRAWSLLDRPRESGQANLVLEKLAQRAAERRRRRLGAFSAACLLLVSGGVGWQIWHSSAALPATKVHVVLPEKQTLADGSVVELKAGAEMAVDFSGSMRRVALRQGEAHFQVASQNRPFVVTARNVDFRAVGTAFSVQLARAQVELLVTEGSVAVERPAEALSGGGRPGDPALELPTALGTVTAGNLLVVELTPTPEARPVAPVAVLPDEIAERLAWRATKLEFTETPLIEAVGLMNQHNRVQLVVVDKDLARMPVSGLFRADRTEAFVRLLEANFGVRADETGGTIHLRRKL